MAKGKEECGCGYQAAVAASTKSDTVLVLVVGGQRADLAKGPWTVLHVPKGCHELPEGIIVSKGGIWLRTMPMGATERQIGDVIPQRMTSYNPRPVQVAGC